ncbi:hypothetical protein [Pseudonocardia sp. MH-G8]|uniref:hypothetical protein n=1 Tax=Pseudonocardia sp. MH-G8 TaxID=1854588 RepID=UPI0018E91EDA|nr:hypothetical protein [Pseudonocardia sp. MH-G8]
MPDAVNARMHVALNRPAVEYSRGIFGHFIEHFHRQIYGGLFDPGSPLSDQQGFRTDVIEAIQELRPDVVRWPGGCFVSGYHWLDGVGPDRVPSWDKAWRVEDPNTFGTDEFIEWCRAVGTTPYICTNAGTGTAEEMSDWLEYCNLPAAGRWARCPVPVDLSHYASLACGGSDRLATTDRRFAIRSEPLQPATAARAGSAC